MTEDIVISVRYLVHDVDAAIAFYKHLGFTLRQQFGPAMAIMARDDLTLWLAGPRASAAKPMPDGRKPEPGGWNRFVLQVTDLAGSVTTLRAQGVHVPQRHRRRPGRAADPLRGSLRQRRGTVRGGGGKLAGAVHRARRSQGCAKTRDSCESTGQQRHTGGRSGDLVAPTPPRCLSLPAQTPLRSPPRCAVGRRRRNSVGRISKKMRATPDRSTDVAITDISAHATNVMSFRTPDRGRLRRPPPPRSVCHRRHGWRRRPHR